MLPLLRGKEVEQRTFYWHFPHRGAPSSSVIEGDWKLVRQIISGQYELFDLKTDPEEENDRAAEQPERVERMVQMLEEHLRESGAQRMRANPEWDPDQTRGKVKHYGVFYSADGQVIQMVEESRPRWFMNRETK